MDSKQFPPIGSLFSEAWHLFTKKALKLLVLWVYILLANVLLFFVAGIIFVAFGFSKIAGHLGDTQTMMNALLTPDVIGLGVILLVVYIICISAVSLAYMAGSILVFEDTQDKSAMDQFKKGFHFALPILVTSVIAFFFTFGSSFLLFIPSLIIGVFFMFAYFIVVLENKKGMAALRMSVGMVSQHFGDIIGRIILFWLAYIVIVFLIPSVFFSGKDVRSLGALVRGILNIFGGWYSGAYIYLLYKHTRAQFDDKKPVSFTWIWMVSIIGWIIAILIGYGVFTYVKNHGSDLMNSIKKMENKNQIQKDVKYNYNYNYNYTDVKVDMPSEDASQDL